MVLTRPNGPLVATTLPCRWCPGYEIIGTVVAAGPGAERLREGTLRERTRVGVPWLAWSCGE